jgi:hypothetical protein
MLKHLAQGIQTETETTQAAPIRRVSTLSVFYLLKPTKNGLIAPLTRLLGEPKPDSYLGGLSVRFQGLQLRARDKFQGISRALNLDAIALATAYAEVCTYATFLVLNPRP